MSAELATNTQTHNDLDLHAAIAEVLPQPENKTTALLDTPIFAAILRERKLTYETDPDDIAAAQERKTFVANMRHETPLFAALLDSRPVIPTDYIVEFSEAAAEAAVPARETLNAWFTPQQPGNFDYDRSETLPPPTRPVRPSASSVWSVSAQLPSEVDTRLATPEPAEVMVAPRIRTATPNTTARAVTVPKQRSLFTGMRAKIANGWRRLTARSSKSYVPAIPNW